MNRLFCAAILVMAFVVGGLTTSVAEAEEDPAAEVKSSQAKWEYKCLHFHAARDQQKMDGKFNELGGQGWELVSGVGVGNSNMTLSSWCFKRSLP